MTLIGQTTMLKQSTIKQQSYISKWNERERLRPEQETVRGMWSFEAVVVKHGRFVEKLGMDKPFRGSGIETLAIVSSFGSVLELPRPLHRCLSEDRFVTWQDTRHYITSWFHCCVLIKLKYFN